MEPGKDVDRIERFREIYDATYPRIMAYTHRRARSPEDALDAVSETFVVVWHRLNDIPTGSSTIPWVYGVARRTLANQYRSRGRRAGLEHKLKDNAPGTPDGGAFDAVYEALDALRPKDRELLTLVAWEDLDNGEIAEVVGSSEKNVAVQLHRARKRLARELARLGIRPSEENSKQVKSPGGYRTPNKVNGTHQEPGEAETP